MIIVKNLRKPGQYYDSTKLATLSKMISEGVNQRTGGKYIVIGKIQGNTLILNVKIMNSQHRYVQAYRDEQNILVGRISSFLTENGIVADVEVK